MRLRRALVVVAVAGATVTPVASGQPFLQGRDLSEAARASVAQTLYAAKATSVAAEEAADARLVEHRQTIDRLIGKLNMARQRGDAAAAAIETLTREITAQQERHVSELGARDRAYARWIAVFRSGVEDIASTPEGEAALRQFNSGDEEGALAVLDQLTEAADRALQARAAANRRHSATLALDGRAKGRISTMAVIRRFEDVTRLDPDVHRDWVELSRLYLDADQLALARTAAERSAATAQDSRDRATAAMTLGDVLLAADDPAGAYARYSDSLTLMRAAAQAPAPADADAQRDLVVGLSRVGDALVAAGSLAEAGTHYEESLKISRTLASIADGGDRAQRDLAVTLTRFGNALLATGDDDGAGKHYDESLAIARRLAARNPLSAAARRDIAVSSAKVGDVLMERGDGAGARTRYEESVALTEQIAAADPTSIAAQRDRTVALNNLGRALGRQRDFEGARKHHAEALRLARELVSVGAPTLLVQEEVAISATNLGDTLVELNNFEGAWALYQEALDIGAQRAAANPASRAAGRAVIAQTTRIGRLLVAAREFTDARPYLQESLTLARFLSKDNPASAMAQRDLMLALKEMGNLLAEEGQRPEAVPYFKESADIGRRLAQASKTIVAQHNFGEGLQLLGDLLFVTNDLAGAYASYDEAIALRRQLAAGDPAEQRGLLATVIHAGDLRVVAKDVSGARPYYEQALPIARTVAAGAPADADVQRELWATMHRLLLYQDSGMRPQQIVEAIEDFARRGDLSSADLVFLESLRTSLP